jgi:hypothetical protein
MTKTSIIFAPNNKEPWYTNILDAKLGKEGPQPPCTWLTCMRRWLRPTCPMGSTFDEHTLKGFIDETDRFICSVKYDSHFQKANTYVVGIFFKRRIKW